jgi:hypothetical protein
VKGDPRYAELTEEIVEKAQGVISLDISGGALPGERPGEP